ncbi:MAG: recombination-associated protein RdgC [Victivallales bacterium]|nr:recombination-associated protein RdgC [Victivallales bacterium]
MPFERGTVTLTYFYLADKLPADYLELFAANKAGMIDQVKDDPQIGWVSGRTLLENTIDENTCILGGHVYMNMRTAERKVPATLLNAICQRDEIAFMVENNAEKVPAKIRKEIREDAMEKNLMKMPPGITGLPFVIDTVADMLYLGTGSTKQIDNFIAFFYKTTGVEPVPVNVNELMFRLFQQEEKDLPEVTFCAEGTGSSAPARDFLTWLWYISEKTGGKIAVGNYGEFELMIEAPLVFALADDAKGAAESTVKKGGSPLRSAEVKAALTVGKKLRRAKLSFCRGQDIWATTFDADKFAFSSLTLPVGEEMDRHSRFDERITNLRILHEVIQAYFRAFVEAIRSPDWEQTEKDIVNWTMERDSY